jgi:phosphoribosylformimino-5-aminoimidazole carboxamide ribonucleotide (ProFAR) isomerase
MSVPEDVKAVKEAGAQGVIIGKALYTGGISLDEAIKLGAE